MRRTGPDDLSLVGGPAGSPAPTVVVPVVVEVCRCGCTADEPGHAPHPDWPLATAWAWLTRPAGVEAEDELGDVVLDAGLEDDGPEDAGVEDDGDESAYPWWDARSGAGRRRAVLPLVLLGELQAGVLLRALYEVVQRPGGPGA